MRQTTFNERGKCAGLLFPNQKKGRSRNFNVKPFPCGVKAVGYFTGLDVEIFEQNAISQLHESGCFGLNPKPRQANQKKSTLTDAEYTRKLEWKERLNDSSVEQETIAVADDQVTDPFNIPQSLVLFPEEAFFLQHFTNCLQVHDLDDVAIPTESLWKKFSELKETFVECYVAYLYIKSKNWVIKSGIKFGGDFLLYKHGPHYFHATFIVLVARTGEKTSLEYHTSERIAETTGKNFVYLQVIFPDDLEPSEYLHNLDSFTVKEVCTQRKEMANKSKVN